MPDIPVLLAVSAGMVAALNPCGFALLPTYLTLVVAGGDPEQSRAAAVRRALLMTGAMTVGFVAVFGAFGLLVVPLALSLQEYLPWVTIVIGFALVGLGVYLVTGRELLLTTPKLGGTAPGRTARSMVLYGVGYAVASLSCTIGPFLAIATTTFRSGSVPAGVAVFVLYAVGMGITVGVLAVAVALARTGLVTRFRQALPYVGRVSGALLVLAGLYVAYYGWYEVRVFAGGDPNDPVVGAVTAVQGEVAQFVAGVNPWVAVGVLGGLVLLGAAGARRRRGTSPTAEAAEERTMAG
jgi:cytochrome c biogenesis protein CcdA